MTLKVHALLLSKFPKKTLNRMRNMNNHNTLYFVYHMLTRSEATHSVRKRIPYLQIFWKKVEKEALI